MKLKTTIVIVLILFKMGAAHAQLGIGISNPEPSAILDLSNLNKGLLIPRLTSSASILNPAKGLMYFNTTNNKVEVNEGNVSITDWKPVIGGAMGGIGTIGVHTCYLSFQ